MRVLVCGGRDYKKYNRVCDELDKLEVTMLIEGGANGADECARKWAEHYLPEGAEHRTYEADWFCYGRSAGARRNQIMLEDGKPDVVLAFPGGRGTADMVRRAKNAGIQVIQISE